MVSRLPRGLSLFLLDRLRGMTVASRMAGFAAAERLPAAELEAAGRRRLDTLLAFADAHVPAYRSRARDGLASLPVLTKEALRADPDAYRPDKPPPGRTQARHTGGSTGDPLRYLVSADAFSGQWAALYRAWSWSGYTPGDRMATVGGGSLGAAGGWRQRVYDGLRNNVPAPVGALSDSDLDRAAGVLRTAGARLVYGYPSVLYLVARRLGEGGLTGVERVITTSETLFPGQRRTLEASFGAPVFDFYGCNEVNLTTGECERHDGYHLAPECCHVEILDDAGRPVPAGESGRIVGTALDNRAMVFLRYDTGDLGALETAACACGRTLPRIVRLEGRSRDLVRGADGRRVHGVVFNRIVAGFPEVDRYQVIQNDAASLEVRLQCAHEPDPALCERLRTAFVGASGLLVHLSTDAEFEVTAGTKARVVVNRLEGGS